VSDRKPSRGRSNTLGESVPELRTLRVEVAFRNLDEHDAQALAAEVIARAHELANEPEHECDVDVSVQWASPNGETDAALAEPAGLAALADPGLTPLRERPAEHLPVDSRPAAR
jgi:hypothetical protein